MCPLPNRFVLALTLAAALGGSAFAQHAGHGSHGAPAARAESASTQAYRAINERMHKEMDIAYSGDAEIDFMRGMIPHHEAAVAMAKVVLQSATDPVVRRLAEAVVSSQESEIATMRAWLKAKGR